MDRIVHIGLLIAAMFLFAGCYDDAPTPRESSGRELPPATLTLGELIAGHATIPRRITRAEVVHATVTTSNDGNNFRQSLLIEDRGAALALLVGTSAAAGEHYPCGCRVALHPEGLLFCDTLGMVCLGVAPPPGSQQSIAPIESRQQLDRLLVCGDRMESPEPLHTTVSELPELAPGLLVQLDGLRYKEDCEDGCVSVGVESVWSGYRCFVDADGHPVHTYTSPYARFAADPIPQTSLQITGILQHHHTYGFILKPRTAADVSDSGYGNNTVLSSLGQ